MHDSLTTYDLVEDEIAVRRETGFQVEGVATQLRSIDADDHASLMRLYEAVIALERSPDWPFEEPSTISEILELLPAGYYEGRVDETRLGDQILGGWLGRIAGCNLGKPVENGDHWTSAHLRDYLERAQAYPLGDYIPVLDPMPDGFVLRENWPRTTRGRVDGSDRDDDIDYAILALHLLEQHGSQLRTEDVASGWLTYLPFLQVYTAERAAYRNLVRGLPIANAATFENPYREWIGALIRGDAFGWVHPGQPRAAATLAYQDASLSHVANGIYGEMWSAALVASAFTASNACEAIECSLDHIPPRSRLAEALRDLLAVYRTGVPWEVALSHIQDRYGRYSWVHVIGNATVIAAGLLWGKGDFASTVGLTVQSGWDTDSNGATAGSVAGVIAGAKALPEQFVAPLNDWTRSALFGFDGSRISDLAARTTRLAQASLGS